MNAKKLLSLRQVAVRTLTGTALLEIDEWAVSQGEWIHVCGANGSGKSTLVKLLTGRTGTGLEVEGIVERSPELERPFPYVMQHPEAAIVGTTPWEDLLIGLEQAGMEAERIVPKLEESLASVGLQQLQHRPIAELSGGQKQLVAIAGCLASAAPLLVLDEAVSMLDLAARRHVLQAVREQHRRGLTVIWVSHAREELEPADRIVKLHAGRIIYDRVYGSGHTAEAAPGGSAAALEEGAGNEAKRQAVSGCSQRAGDWELNGVAAGGDAAGRPLLQDVNVRLAGGTLTLIVGANGSGKTTLLETIAGLREPKQGELRLGGQPLWRGRRLNREVLLELGVSLQHSESQWFLPQAEQELRFSLRPYRLPEREQQERAVSSLERAGLAPEIGQRNPWTLSGGQQRRLAWACLHATRPSWLLLDEPTAGLDSEGVARLRSRLAEHLAAGGGAVIVTHDADLFASLAARTLRVVEGKVMDWPPSPYVVLSESDGQAAAHLCCNMAAPSSASLSNPAAAIEGEGSAASYDPRALWLAYLMVAAGILLQHSWVGVLLGNAVTAILLVRGRTALRPWRNLMAGYAVMAGIFCLLSGLSFSPLGLDGGGMNRTALYFCKLLPVMALGLGLAAAMTPFRLQRAVEQAIGPLRRIKLPVDMIALTVSLIFRFIPLLRAEWIKLARMMQARGKRGGRGGKVPARDLHRVLLPYLVLLLRMADQMSEALEARGFGSRGVQPTRAWQLRLQARDGYLAGGGALLLALLAASSRWLG